MLVNKLVEIRRTVIDEGLCCNISDGEITPARQYNDLTSDARALQYPWKNLYPDSQTVYKKKTRVRHAGRLFSESFPLLFKTRGKKELSNNKAKSYLKECSNYTVEDVYELLRADFDEDLSTRASHWRLAPTKVIAGIITKLV